MRQIHYTHEQKLESMHELLYAWIEKYKEVAESVGLHLDEQTSDWLL